MQIEKVIDFVLLIQGCRRITIRRLEAETGLHRATIYRYLSVISEKMPLSIEKGVITLSQKR
jgi:hypothetical protein